MLMVGSGLPKHLICSELISGTRKRSSNQLLQTSNDSVEEFVVFIWLTGGSPQYVGSRLLSTIDLSFLDTNISMEDNPNAAVACSVYGRVMKIGDVLTSEALYK